MSILTYNGQNIEQRDTDGYVNGTQMCQANGKRINDWLRLQDTSRYIAAISSVTGIPVTELVVTIQGGDPTKQGSWIHPKLAIKLGRWISVDFELWCDEHIKTLIETGTTSIPKQPQLPSRDVAYFTAERIYGIKQMLGDTDPRLAQLLIDHAISDIMPSGKALNGDRLRGVVELAESLGYQVTMSSRCQLGKFVKARCENLVQMESRLVNGTTRDVCCYPENHPDVIQAIHDFFKN